jgi:hypothetical protein
MVVGSNDCHWCFRLHRFLKGNAEVAGALRGGADGGGGGGGGGGRGGGDESPSFEVVYVNKALLDKDPSAEATLALGSSGSSHGQPLPYEPFASDGGASTAHLLREFAAGMDGLPWLAVLQVEVAPPPPPLDEGGAAEDEAEAEGRAGGAALAPSPSRLSARSLTSFCSAVLEEGEGYSEAKWLQFLGGDNLLAAHRAMGTPLPLPSTDRWR